LKKMQTKEFDYYLPPELIAQQPAAERTDARLMLVNRATGALGHYRAADLPDLLKRGDLMVLNNTRVIPARVFGRRQKSPGRVEALFIEEMEKNIWQVFLHASRRPGPGETILLAEDKITAQVISSGERGRARLKVDCAGDLLKILEETGLPPLPPYIKRPKDKPATDAGRRRRKHDYERYQTVYAKVPGAIAAPTAGLHLSENLLAKIEGAGIRTASLTLHVGPGTFVPVRCERVEEHKMESERYIVEPEAAEKINQAMNEKRRIVAVGTTSVRALESAALAGGKIAAGNGRTEIFIYPPFRFQVAGALLTNFHLPCSTLLMLVSAFAGRELIRRAYETAVREKYRFYSYGDCMLIV